MSHGELSAETMAGFGLNPTYGASRDVHSGTPATVNPVSTGASTGVSGAPSSATWRRSR